MVTRWKYHFVTFTLEEDLWRLHSVNGVRVPEEEQDLTEYQYAERVGSAGWELVAYNTVVQSKVLGFQHDPLRYHNLLHEIRMVFKRPMD